MFRFGEGFFEFNANDKNFRTALSRIKSSLSSLRNGFRITGRAARNMLAIGTAALAKTLKDAADTQDIEAKFKAVFDGIVEESDKFAANLAKSYGKSKAEIKGFMANLQDTLVPMGLARDDAAKLSGTLTQLAFDLGKWERANPVDVLEDLKSGVIGLTRGLLKYGIRIDEATLKAKLLSSGMVENAKDATETQKIMARFALIMERSRDAQGAVIKSSNDLTVRLSRLKAKASDISRSIGKTFIPVFEKWGDRLEILSDKLVKFVEQDMDSLEKGIIKTGKTLLLVWLAPALITGIVGLIKLLSTVKVIMTGLLGVSTVLASTITGVLGIAILGSIILWGKLEARIFKTKMAALEAEAAFKKLKSTITDLHKAQKAYNDAVTLEEKITAKRDEIGYQKELIKQLKKKLEIAKDEIWAKQKGHINFLGGVSHGVPKSELTEEQTALNAKARSLERQNKLLEEQERILKQLEEGQKNADARSQHTKGKELEQIRVKELNDELDAWVATEEERERLQIKKDADELKKLARTKDEKAKITEAYLNKISILEAKSQSEDDKKQAEKLRKYQDFLRDMELYTATSEKEKQKITLRHEKESLLARAKTAEQRQMIEESFLEKLARINRNEIRPSFIGLQEGWKALSRGGQDKTKRLTDLSEKQLDVQKQILKHTKDNSKKTKQSEFVLSHP